MSAKKYLKATEQQQEAEQSRKEQEDRLFQSLKLHIIRERERKKQLEEETAKEEQMRVEREAREKQDKMTLGKTKEELALVEHQMIQLKNKKQNLFLQLKVLLTNEDELKKRRKEAEAQNMRNSAPIQVYQPYTAENIKDQQAITSKSGVKRTRSPVPVADFYKQHVPQSQNVYYPPKTDTGKNEMRRAVLWDKSAQYQTQHQGWSTYRYPAIPQSVPQPHSILHLNNDRQQPPQLVKQVQPAPTQNQKAGSISIEKIDGRNHVGDMRAGIPSQQDFTTIHRRHQLVVPSTQGQQQPPSQQNFTFAPQQPQRPGQQVQIAYPGEIHKQWTTQIPNK